MIRSPLRCSGRSPFSKYGKEIVMTQWRKNSANEVYAADEIVERLKAELPAWYLEDGWIRRKYKTSGWKSTLMVVNTVGHLAEAAWHHPDLNVSYAFVIVKLTNHSAKGITDKDFALAKKIEEVLTWRPGAEPDAVLEGTPDDPRFKYLKYD
jgi:4a-hydroxytetrahydrobiopterin dehydratase